MLWRDIGHDAWQNLWRKKSRTFLTMTGVAIGIFTIFVTVALADGIKNFLVYQMKSYGNPKAIQVYLKGGFNPDRMFQMRMSGLGRTPKPLREEVGRFELKFLKEENLRSLRTLPGVKSVGALLFFPLNSIRLDGQSEKFDVVQIPFVAGESLDLVAGRNFAAKDAHEVILSYSYIAAFGYQRAEELLGKQVIVSVPRIPFAQIFLSLGGKEKQQDYQATIVGFLSEGLLSTAAYFPEDFAVAMGRFSFGLPNLFTPENYGFMARVVVEREELIPTVERQIEAQGYHTISVLDRMENLSNTFRVVQGVLSLFGLIAVLVAGLGIINTLVMSINERKREIGVMKAVGATRGNITMLYAVEAAAIGACGCIQGLVAGVVVGNLVNLAAAHFYPGYWKVNALMSFDNPFLIPALLLFGTIIGLLAGIYPARSAASLDPIRALKYE